MQPRANVSLRDYSSMKLGGNAAYVVDVTDHNSLVSALSWASAQHLPVIMIGGGSNIVWKDEGFHGLLIINRISRYEDFDEDGVNHYVTIGAGDIWDAIVERAASDGLSGIEALSLIPGTAGATPVQNVGAYGQEIANTLTTVEAYDTKTGGFVTIPGSDCGFGYRTSRFKTTDKGRFFITAITLHLTLSSPQPPFYPALTNYFALHNITSFTPWIVRDAVIDIRSHKFPNPLELPNNGSFFTNPIIDDATFTQIVSDYEEIPHWQVGQDQIKLSAAWLIERAGFKGFHDPETGMGVWRDQPLVLVNEHAKSTADLLKFKQRIVDGVQSRFGVTLAQEPELLP